MRSKIGAARFYQPRRNEPDAAFAARIVREVGGPEAAIEVFRDRSNGLPDAVRGFVAQTIIKQLGEAEQVAALTDPAESDRLADRAARFIADDVFEATTSAGQFIQSFAAFSRLSPKGMLGVYRLAADRAARSVRERLAGGISRIGHALQQVNADGLQDLASDPAAQRATSDAVRQAIEAAPDVQEAVRVMVVNGAAESPTVRRAIQQAVRAAFTRRGAVGASSQTLWGRYVADAVRDVVRRPEGRRPTVLGEFAGAVSKTLRETVTEAFGVPQGTAAPEGLSAVQRLASVASNPEKAQEVWSAVVKKLRSQFPNDSRVDRLAASPANLWSRELVREAVADELRAAGVSMREVVAGHYRLLGDGQTLADRIVARAGLDPESARQLARLVDDAVRTEAFRVRSSLDDRVQRVRADEGRRSRLARAAESGVVSTDLVVESELDAAIRTELRRLRTSIGQVLREHFTTWGQTGQTLAERFAAGLRVPKPVADGLASKLQSRFGELLRERRRREIIRQAESLPRQYRRKLPIERIGELASLGLLDQQRIWEAIREPLGLPSYSSDVAAEVVRRANALQGLPEGVRRDEAAIDLLRYISRAGGIRPVDLAMAFWYANVLSGPFTHLMNSAANLGQVAAHSVFAATRNPASIPFLLEALADGFRAGAADASRVLSTGKVTGSRAGAKLSAGSPLEALGDSAWWERLLGKWKFVARALSAEDMLFYRAAEAQRVAVLARAVARDEGLAGPAAERRAREILWGSDEARARADATVKAEGLTGALADKRRRELLAAERPGSLNEDAAAHALRVTFNAEPYGVLGAVARWVKPLLSEVPAIRLVIPFVDVVANVTNESLNYFPPVGVYRAARARVVGELNGKPLDRGTEAGRADLWDQQAKAALGTAVMTLVAAAAAGGLDDEDPEFAVYGSGPGDAGKAQLMRARGWRPWTVKIGDRYWSYAETPLALTLGVVGSYMDALRWRKMDQASALDRVAMSMMAAPRIMVQRSFLRGLSDFFVGLSRESSPRRAGEKAAETASTIASGFVVPGLVKQIDRLWDPTVTDTRTVLGAMASQIPIARKASRPALNALGDAVQASPLDRITSPVTKDPLVRVLTDRQAWVSVPDQGDLTDDEYYALVRERGAILRPALESLVPSLRVAEPKIAQAIVDRVSRRATAQARAQVVGRR